jgi:hypothetical protein
VQAIRIASLLCLDFQIYSGPIVASIVESLARLKGFDSLVYFLDTATGVPRTWHLDSMESAWKSLVTQESQAGSPDSLVPLQVLLRF